MKFYVFLLTLLLSCSSYAQVSTAIAACTEDTYVQTGSALDFSALTIGQIDVSGTQVRRMYLKFDISALGIPSNAVISSAKIRLRISSESGVTASSQTVQRALASWSETTIQSATQPALETSDQTSSSDNTTTPGYREYDVAPQVRNMIITPSLNLGFCVRTTTETVTTSPCTYFTKNHATSTFRPVLEIQYYMPMRITSATIEHASTTSAHDGSIAPVFADGSGGSTYKWYKNGGTTAISTAASLSGEGYGWYGLEVTNTKGDKFYYSFIIGVKCSTVSISYNPGPNYIDDMTYLTSGIILGVSSTDGGSTAFSAAKATRSANNSLMRFRLWMPENLGVTQSDLSLKGSSHNVTVNNESILLRTTQDWVEYPVYYLAYTPPAFSTDITKIIPNQTVATAIAIVDMNSFWNYWKFNNVQNYGMTLKLNTANVTNQTYYSSDAVSSTNYPSITFSVLGDCEDTYAQLEYDMDGYYHIMKDGKIRFVFNQEYDAANLTFNLYNSNDMLVKTQANFPVIATTNGMNYLTLTVQGTYCIGEGFFYLEVINSKKEKMYLRFYNDYKGCVTTLTEIPSE